MNKKIINFILVFIITICSFGVIALANTNGTNFEDTKKEIESDKNIEKFYDYVNELNLEGELIEGMSAKEYVEKFLENGTGTLDINTFIKTMISYAFREVGMVLKLLTSVLVIALISALLKNLQNAFNNDGISNVAFFACYSLSVMILTSSFLLGVSIAKDVIQNLIDFMAVIMPVLFFLLSTAGGIASAVTIDPVVVLLVSVAPKIYIDFIFPLIFMYFVLQFVNNMTTKYKISNVCKIIKQTAMWSQGIVLTIFVGIITIRGISANTIDAVTLKTAKFAVDNFIPIVGKSFSDAITTVAGYSLVLKSAISSVGIIVVIGIILYPIIKMIVMIFSYRLTSAIIQPIADEKLVKVLDSIGDATTMILGCVVSISVMFFIIIAIMSSAGRFVVGG
ncbi:MAG: stage III sporulation protein AE [Sarcina sp.]